MQNTSAIITIMMKAAQKAGRAIRRDFGEIENLQISRKSLTDFVSSSDIKSQEIIIETLKEARPKYGIIAEELNKPQKGSDIAHDFIIDPIDGTNNFIHGFPYFCISIALREQNEITAGVIFNPLTEEMFYAEKGQGAFLHHPFKSQRLRVSQRKELSDSLVATYGIHNNFENFQKLYKQTNTRNTHCLALDLAHVAAGKMDALLTWKPMGKVWDYAAGALMIKESGGFVYDSEGTFIAGNVNIAETLKDYA